jgi:hypothetical protein
MQPDIEAQDDEKLTDEEDDELNLTMDHIRTNHKINAYATIEAFWIRPPELSRLRIFFCRILVMPLVRQTFALKSRLLEDDFVHGYHQWSCCFLCVYHK